MEIFQASGQVYLRCDCGHRAGMSLWPQEPQHPPVKSKRVMQQHYECPECGRDVKVVVSIKVLTQ